MALPKTLGTCADRLYEMEQDLRALKKKHEAEQTKYKKKIDELRDHALALMNKQKIDETSGQVGRLKRDVVNVVNAENWDAIFGYAKAHDAPDLYQRRLNAKAVFDRLEAGETIPGVKVDHLMKIKILKVK